MNEGERMANWPMIAGIAGAAALAGFGISRWIMPAQNPVPPAETAAPAAAAPVEVAIPAAYIASADISVEPVAAGSVDAEVTAPASVAAVPGGEATVVARASGTVTRVMRRLGDPVRAGETVALVSSLDAASMAADRSVAAAKVDLARKAYAREAGLFRQGVTPRQDMEAAQSALVVAEAEARRAASVASAAHVSGSGGAIAVVSPIAGRITAECVTIGAFVEPQSELFRVANNGAVQLEAAVSAADARRLAAGDIATIIVGTGAPIPAVVRSITPTVSGASQSATVVIVPRAGSDRLSIGEGAQVRIRARRSGRGGLLVAEDAVQTIDGRDVLFVRTAKGFRAQPVLVGTRSGGLAQILSGVKPGDRVATRNAFLLKAESRKGAEEE
jgi:cobalt-zinc-cadmium efflux system membrane fusion protein